MKISILKLVLAFIVLAFMYALSSWAVTNDKYEFLLLNIILIMIPLSMLFEGITEYLSLWAEKLDNN